MSKFLPRLSTITEPLRQLLYQDAEWKWLQEHEDAVTTLKGLISTAPVLRYFDCTKQISLQCDASESGLGYANLQEGQPIAFGARGLTQMERKYAQIEKEMLAIVGGCEKFDQYIYGQRVIVETDHKPLVSVYKKPIHNAPKRLQCMLLHIKRYDLEITYKKGKEIYPADGLSRAYPKESEPHSTPPSEFCHSIEEIDLTEHLAISRERLQSIQEATAIDPGLKVLMQVVQQGWPHSKSQVPVEAQPYFTSHDELSVQDGLVFKGQRIIIPAALRQETIRKLHSSHVGVEACLRRAREVLYWPLMSAEIKDYVSCCSVCNMVRPAQSQESLKSHDVPNRPWSKVHCSNRLFVFNGENFIVVVDYYSNFLEVECLNSTTSSTVVQFLKAMFARHGIPDIVVSDNGPQYSSEEFRKFALAWEFKHITTSPQYPRSNGKAESAVKICKTLLKKSQLSKSDLYLALLDYHNTPTEQTNLSPAQRLYGCRTRTLLPLSLNLFQPELQPVGLKVAASQVKQAKYYNWTAKPLEKLQSGQLVRVKLPGDDKWSLGTCKREVGPRSYLVECGGKMYCQFWKYWRQ